MREHRFVTALLGILVIGPILAVVLALTTAPSNATSPRPDDHHVTQLAVAHDSGIVVFQVGDHVCVDANGTFCWKEGT